MTTIIPRRQASRAAVLLREEWTSMMGKSICSFQSEGQIALLGKLASLSHKLYAKSQLTRLQLWCSPGAMASKRLASVPGSVMTMNDKSQSCRQPACLCLPALKGAQSWKWLSLRTKES